MNYTNILKNIVISVLFLSLLRKTGIYKDTRRLGLIITAEGGPDGYVLWNVMNTRRGKINGKRKGLKVLYGK